LIKQSAKEEKKRIPRKIVYEKNGTDLQFGSQDSKDFSTKAASSEKLQAGVAFTSCS
jgi:hypothetical protein